MMNRRLQKTNKLHCNKSSATTAEFFLLSSYIWNKKIHEISKDISWIFV